MRPLLQPTKILVSTNAAGKCPEVAYKISRGFTFTNVKTQSWIAVTCNLTTYPSGPQYDGQVMMQCESHFMLPPHWGQTLEPFAHRRHPPDAVSPQDMMHLRSIMDVLQTQMDTISWVTKVGICPLSWLLACPPLSPQVGVSVMDSISPHTTSASWYKAAPPWTWTETQLLFGLVYVSKRARDRVRKRRKGATVSVSQVAWIQAAVNGDR